jgi:hypothetical protein
MTFELRAVSPSAGGINSFRATSRSSRGSHARYTSPKEPRPRYDRRISWPHVRGSPRPTVSATPAPMATGSSRISASRATLACALAIWAIACNCRSKALRDAVSSDDSAASQSTAAPFARFSASGSSASSSSRSSGSSGRSCNVAPQRAGSISRARRINARATALRAAAGVGLSNAAPISSMSRPSSTRATTSSRSVSRSRDSASS